MKLHLNVMNECAAPNPLTLVSKETRLACMVWWLKLYRDNYSINLRETDMMETFCVYSNAR